MRRKSPLPLVLECTLYVILVITQLCKAACLLCSARPQHQSLSLEGGCSATFCCLHCRNHLAAFNRAFQTSSCCSGPSVPQQTRTSGGEGPCWSKGVSPKMYPPPHMFQRRNECWHKAVYILRILTSFLQGGNSRLSDGRDYVHLASCWYYDMDMCTRSSHGWVCYVTGHILNCVSNCRPVSTSFLKSLISQSFRLLVALTHVSKQIFHFSPCSP